jgi:Transposase DDE domain group 1
LAAINRELIGKAETITSPQSVVLDMDSTEIAVYGQREHSAYDGHFESTCYHPLLLKEGKQAVKITRLSCHCFWSDEVRFG